MRKKGPKDSGTRSLKTLFLYIALVVALIVISLSIKAFFVFQKSLFDGRNHFTVAVVKEGRVAEVVAFHPKIPSLALVKLEGDTVSRSDLGRILAVAPDAIVESNRLPVGDDVAGTMVATVWKYHAVKTNLTIFDAVRLSLLSRNIQEDNKIVKVVKLPEQDSDIDKLMSSFFSDETIATENTPIHIINASDIPGTGKRLERVLANLGGNVIGVSTATTPISKSKIEFIGESESYTVKKLKRVLSLPAFQLREQTGADIVVTIGEDSEKATAF